MVALLRHQHDAGPGHGADLKHDRAGLERAVVPVGVGFEPGRLRLVVDNVGSEPRSGGLIAQGSGHRAARSGVHGPARITGARGQVALLDRTSLGLLVVAAVVIFGGLLWVRAAQGGATAETWVGVDQVAAERSAVVAPDAAAAAVSADGTAQTVVVGPGDTLWSIAEDSAPDSDPRPLVAALIEVNGGASVQIGQQIIIPEQLLD